MREIKFDIKIRHIETGNTFREVFTLDEIISGSKLYAKGIQEVVFKRQFTGLKDKNGKEIYEGDILKIQDMSFCFMVEFKNAYVGGWVLSNPISQDFISLGARTQDSIEVIGNIYETPELLS